MIGLLVGGTARGWPDAERYQPQGQLTHFSNLKDYTCFRESKPPKVATGIKGRHGGWLEKHNDIWAKWGHNVVDKLH